MLGRREGPQRTVQRSGLAVGIDQVELALVAHDAVGEDVAALVLMRLIDIGAAGLGRIEQRQAQRVVRGLVPAVARVVEDGHAVLARAVGQVGPFVAVDLILVIAVIAATDAAQANVVGRLGIAERQRELSLQQRILRAPIDHVLDVDAAGLTALVEADVLSNLRLTIFLFDTQRLAQRTVLLYRDADVVVDADGLLVERALMDLPGGPGLRAAVVEDHEAQAPPFGHELASRLLVVEGGDVAVGINHNIINGVGEAHPRPLPKGGEVG